MPSLNRHQLASLWFGVLLIIAIGLVPPWREATGARHLLNYAPIVSPPASTPLSGVTIDFARLAVEWVMASVLTGGLVASFKKERQGSLGGEASKAGGIELGAIDREGLNRENVFQSALKAKAQGSVESAGLNGSSGGDSSCNGQTMTVLDFPGENFGELLVESKDDPDYWESYSTAAGAVAVPKDKHLQLELTRGKALDLRKLESLPADAFYSMDLSGSMVTDSDLAHLRHFTALQELDLSDTTVSDLGIKNLSALTGLRKIWLDRTRVSATGLEYLADLAKHGELIKISLVGAQAKELEVDASKECFRQKCEVVLGDGD